LIDTSVLIEHERGRVNIARWIEGREDQPFMISAITVSELLHGVHRATERVQRARRSAFVEAILDRFPILPLDLPTARQHAELWAELSAAGRMIGPHDLWLAAACIAHGLILATANTREFSRIAAVEVENWSEP